MASLLVLVLYLSSTTASARKLYPNETTIFCWAEWQHNIQIVSQRLMETESVLSAAERQAAMTKEMLADNLRGLQLSGAPQADIDNAYEMLRFYNPWQSEALEAQLARQTFFPPTIHLTEGLPNDLSTANLYADIGSQASSLHSFSSWDSGWDTFESD